MMLLGEMMKYGSNGGLLLLILYTMRTSLVYTFLHNKRQLPRGIDTHQQKNQLPRTTTRNSFSAPRGGMERQ